MTVEDFEELLYSLPDLSQETVELTAIRLCAVFSASTQEDICVPDPLHEGFFICSDRHEGRPHRTSSDLLVLSCALSWDQGMTAGWNAAIRSIQAIENGSDELREPTNPYGVDSHRQSV